MQLASHVHMLPAGTPAPEAEPSSGALSTDGVNASPVRDVAMASTAPADAELLDDADTEANAGSADRYKLMRITTSAIIVHRLLVAATLRMVCRMHSANL